MLNNIAAITGGALPEVGDYESIATTTVGSGGSSTITFSSIPSTYKHLQVRGIGSTSIAGKAWGIRLNNDAGSNYSYHYLQGTGSVPETGAAATQTLGYIGTSPESTNNNYVGAAVIDLLDYANANKYKTIRSLSGADMNGVGGYSRFNSSLWQSKNAINRVDLVLTSGSFNQYSSFALYGIN
jgi:hypothetical protein